MISSPPPKRLGTETTPPVELPNVFMEEDSPTKKGCTVKELLLLRSRLQYTVFFFYCFIINFCNSTVQYLNL